MDNIIKRLDEFNVGDIFCNDKGQKFIYLAYHKEKEEHEIMYISAVADERNIIKINMANPFNSQDLESLTFIDNIYDICNGYKAELEEYCWMGIEYSNYKLLINIKNLNVEYYNLKDEVPHWDVLDEINIDINEDENELYIKLDNVQFKISLNDLNVKILTEYTIAFKDYYNFLLGKNNEFVFDEINQLGIYR